MVAVQTFSPYFHRRINLCIQTMADEPVTSNFFTWVISTIMTAIIAGLGWLGIHTKRLNELNLKLAVAIERDEHHAAMMEEMKADIKDIKEASKNDMQTIVKRWDDQITVQNKLTGVLLTQTNALSGHAERLELLEKTTNFKVEKGS